MGSRYTELASRFCTGTNADQNTGSAAGSRRGFSVAAIPGPGGCSGPTMMCPAAAPTDFQMQPQTFVEKSYFKGARGLLGGDRGGRMALCAGDLVQSGSYTGRAGLEVGV